MTYFKKNVISIKKNKLLIDKKTILKWSVIIFTVLHNTKDSSANNNAEEPNTNDEKKIFSLGGYFLGGGAISPSTTKAPGFATSVLSLLTGVVLVLLSLFNKLFEESCTLCKVTASSGDNTSSASLQDCKATVVKITTAISVNFFIRLIFTNVLRNHHSKQKRQPLVYKKSQGYCKLSTAF